MRNIQELIGIIEGINFDGIINEKEVERISLWTETNRALAYKKKYIDLIELLDKVLEDKVITDEERENVLILARDFQMNNGESVKIFELNGIIEGIISDGVLNNKEIYHLKKWLEQYIEYVSANKTSRKIYEMINEILSDGIVTSKEREKLLGLLSQKINSYHFEAKIEYLRKQVKDRKNIGVDLIDLLDDELVIQRIHTMAEAELKHSFHTYTGSVQNPEIVFISLVIIAIFSYDSIFYDSVRDTYKQLYEKFSEQKIEGQIRTIINRYRTDEERASGRNRIITTVLKNAIVPSYYLPNFFEFVYDIYSLNFEYVLPDKIYDEFKDIYDNLRDIMLDTTQDNIEIKVTRKSYKLIKSTQELIISEKDLDSIIKLSVMVVELIDKYYWNKDITVSNVYLEQGFNAWKNSLSATINEKGKEFLRSQWEPKFVLIEKNIYLIPPVHKIKSIYDFKNITQKVYNGQEILYVEQQCDIREIIGGYKLIPDPILLNKPLGEISYEISCGDSILYNSKNKLVRNVIVFNENGEEIKNNTDYSGLAVICHQQSHDKLQTYCKMLYYNLSILDVSVGDLLPLEGTVLNFSSMTKPGLYGEKYTSTTIEDSITGKKLDVYKSVKHLVFESEQNNADYEIRINNKKYNINDLNIIKTPRGNYFKYIVDITLSKTAIYNIEVLCKNEDKTEKIAVFHIALDTNLAYSEKLINNETYVVKVFSDFSNINEMREINVFDFSVDWLQFKYNGNTYIYNIPFNFNFHRLTDLEWQTDHTDLWVGDINQASKLELYGEPLDKVLIYASTGEKLDEITAIKHNGISNSMRIGFLMSYKNLYDYIVLIFMFEGNQKRALFCYNRCVMEDTKTEIIFNSLKKELVITPIFYGYGNVYLKIKNPEGMIVYESGKLSSGNTITIDSLQSFVNYSIEFYEKEKGSLLRKERLLKKYEKTFWGWDDFINHRFKISKVYFDQNIRGKFERKSHYFNKNYVIFLEKIEDRLYSGEIIAKNLKGDFKLNAINPVQIEICSDVIDDKLEVAITKNGDGLLLDFEHHNIKNTMDDNTAIDIISYVIDLNGVEIID